MIRLNIERADLCLRVEGRLHAGRSETFWSSYLFSVRLLAPESQAHCFRDKDFDHRLAAYSPFHCLLGQPAFNVGPELPLARETVGNDSGFALAGFFLKLEQGMSCINR